MSRATLTEHCYGQWLRDPAHAHELTRAERRFLEDERAWDADNPREVEALEKLVGRAVRLRKTYRTYAVTDRDKAAEARSAPPRARLAPSPDAYMGGRKLVVFARAGRSLLARMGDGTVLLVRAGWVRETPM